MTERILEIGTQKYTQVVCLDEPGAGGACYEYSVRTMVDPQFQVAFVHFQNGPVKEAGINGCYQEDLLVIVQDRLEHFQRGPFSCWENAIALTKVEEALFWLRKRTTDRKRRGVEGTNVK